jgi:hypothetical protein
VRLRGSSNEQTLVIAGLILAAYVVIWVMQRRVERYRARNDAGLCAHCPAALEGRRTRAITYRVSKTGEGTDIDVCLPCFDRHRGGRVMFWSFFLPCAAVLFWWLKR